MKTMIDTAHATTSETWLRIGACLNQCGAIKIQVHAEYAAFDPSTLRPYSVSIA